MPAHQAPQPVSLTGKRLTGANARRRKQAHKRRTGLAVATFEFWLRQPNTEGTTPFDALQAELRHLSATCVHG